MGLTFPFPGDLPDPGIKPGYSALQADSLPTEPLGKPSIYTTAYTNLENVKKPHTKATYFMIL